MRNYSNLVSQRILIFLYYYMKVLTIITLSIDWKKLKVQAISGFPKIFLLTFRITMFLIYVARLPGLIKTFLQTPQLYNRYMGPVQEISLATLTAGIFIYQTFVKERLITVVDKFLEIYHTIWKKGGTGILFGPKCTTVLILKLTATAIGLVYDTTHDSRIMPKWTIEYIVAGLGGHFVWMETVVSFDICFIGIIVTDIFYCQMENHLKDLKQKLIPLQYCQSRHEQMKILCESSDELEECGLILSKIYRAANEFIEVCQLSFIYCIFCNFMYLLLQLNESFWDYRMSKIMPWRKVCACIPKVVNLLLLISCADATSKRSKLPMLIGFEVICSSMDFRFDESVESFLGRQKVEHLQIRVLGLFQLNNEFALLLLSGGITYLFLLIQFNMMWPDHKQPLV